MSARNRFPGTVIAVIGVIGVVVLIGTQWWQEQPQPTTSNIAPIKPTEPSDVPLVKRPSSNGLRAACRFEVGDTFAYDISERSSWRIDLAQDADSPFAVNLAGVAIKTRQQGRAHLRWRLDMRAVEVPSEGGAIFVATVSQPTITSNNVPMNIGPQRMTVPMLIRIGKRCDVQSMARGQTVQPEAGRAQQALVARLTWRLPPAADSMSYKEVEHDAIGVHSYDYKVGTQSPPRLLRTQTATSELYMFDSRGGSATVRARGSCNVEVGDSGWFDAFRCNHARTFVDNTPYARVHSILTATPIKPDKLTIKVKDTVTGWVWGDLFAVRAALSEAAAGLAGWLLG